MTRRRAAAAVAIVVTVLALAVWIRDDDRHRADGPPGAERAPAAAPRPAGPDGRIPGAAGDVVVGISDQHPDFLADERFRDLAIRHVRLILPWDAALVAPADVERWLGAAREAGVEVLIAFSHISGERCPRDPCTAPAPRELGRAFAEMRERWPWVTQYSTWNEPNHPTQPLRERPELLAEYHRELRRLCPDCTLLAADFVADGDPRPYVRRFTRALGEEPRLWGVHNYADANRLRTADTRRFLDLVPGEVWITETGGIVELAAGGPDRALEPDEARAERAVGHLSRFAALDPRITRLYVYQWRKTNPGDRFDAGLTRLDGSARPALGALRSALAR